MPTELVKTEVNKAIQEKVLLKGDLSDLTPDERLSYYGAVCESLGLNPLTRPFEYLELNKKLVLYARKDCTDQLRARPWSEISVEITDRRVMDDIIVVTARAIDRTTGRTDESIGAVPRVKENGQWVTSQGGKNYFKGDGTYKPLAPDDLGNAMMKAETKAKRRVTLSFCGLGVLDETEVEDIPPEPHAIPATLHSKNEARTKLGQIQMEGIQEKPPSEGVAQELPPPGWSPEGHDDVAAAQTEKFEGYEAEVAKWVSTFRAAGTADALNGYWQELPPHIKADPRLYPEYSSNMKALSKMKKKAG